MIFYFLRHRCFHVFVDVGRSMHAVPHGRTASKNNHFVLVALLISVVGCSLLSLLTCKFFYDFVSRK